MYSGQGGIEFGLGISITHLSDASCPQSYAAAVHADGGREAVCWLACTGIELTWPAFDYHVSEKGYSNLAHLNRPGPHTFRTVIGCLERDGRIGERYFELPSVGVENARERTK